MTCPPLLAILVDENGEVIRSYIHDDLRAPATMKDDADKEYDEAFYMDGPSGFKYDIALYVRRIKS